MSFIDRGKNTSFTRVRILLTCSLIYFSETRTLFDTWYSPNKYVLTRREADFSGALGWLSQLNIWLHLSHDLTVRELETHVRLYTDSSEPGSCFRFCVSLSLCPFLLTLCLFLKNKYIKKIVLKRREADFSWNIFCLFSHSSFALSAPTYWIYFILTFFISELLPSSSST